MAARAPFAATRDQVAKTDFIRDLAKYDLAANESHESMFRLTLSVGKKCSHFLKDYDRRHIRTMIPVIAWI